MNMAIEMKRGKKRMIATREKQKSNDRLAEFLTK